MKLNLNWNLKDLDDKEIPSANVGKVIGQAIASTNKGNSLKLDDWARTLWKGKDLEIDNTDVEILLALVENNETLTILTKAAVRRYIEKVKEKSDKK